MALVKLRLIVDIEFEANTTSTQELEQRMEKAIQIGMGEGLFTGESDAEVETWESRVEVIPA